MIYVKYENGKQQQGVVLALGGQWIRVAIQGSDDAVEYRQVSGRWISEDCEVVNFKFTDSAFGAQDQSDLPTIFPSGSDVAVAPRIM